MHALKRLVRGKTAVAVALLAALTVGSYVAGEERKFVVMLAHSPKSFETGGQPGVPSGGLPDVNTIDRQYFSRNPGDGVGSFVEYWDEISYGDVHITGRVPGWVTLPWAFDPNPPNAAARPSPENFTNLRRGAMQSEGSEVTSFIPSPYGYGAGEDFCDCFHDQTGELCFSSGDTSPAISSGDCGGLIIIDYVGGRQNAPPPVRFPGMNDRPAVGIDVWTPGERFLDVDGDNRWDGIDEFNDTICLSPDGCRESHCSISDRPCTTNLQCPTGETCMPPDPLGSGPRGCRFRGCGNLAMPWINWDGNEEANNCSNCVLPVMPPCRNNGDCQPFPGDSTGTCDTLLGRCLPAMCIWEQTNCTVDLPPCCTGGENDPPDCVEDGVEGLNCGQNQIFCCEFDDSTDDNNQANPIEPFEDYMVRWNPLGGSPASVWEPVDETYIRANYPGDVEKLVRRTGNGIYDPPDVFLDVLDGATEISTKMMQDAGANQFAWKVPKPGTYPAFAFNVQVDEQPWFDQFWVDRYGTPPPAWPGFDPVFAPLNSPRMRPFDPNEPNPPVVRGQAGRRWFQPNRGGRDGNGNGTLDDPNLVLSPGLDDPPGTILPEEVYGYYDGWVEHDDLPSSKYHFQGDKRLGEITSPSTDTVDLPSAADDDGTYTAIFGADLGLHDPSAPQGIRDQIVPAAGPYAVKIHGEKGFDAGDVCILEWLTWRADVNDENGNSTIDEFEHHRTVGHHWAVDNGFYHPFAGPATPRSGGPIGFKDYNLDGMIDQGEVRPERSENYSVDLNLFTPNDGTVTVYPFNRRRMLEDVVEALDPTVDWDDFIDPNSMAANLCRGGGPSYPEREVSDNLLFEFDAKNFFLPFGGGDPDYFKAIEAEGFVSGIVITPPNAWTDINLFPLAPSFYPVHNEDNNSSTFMIPDYPADPFSAAEIHQSFNLFFHDLVICANCRSPSPGVTPYAAHEYMHSWQGFPDLYDYDVFRNPPSDDINCPIGAWDIMAGTGHGAGSLVHPVPILKEGPCTNWIDPIDLTTVLTPGVETSLTLPPAELVRDNSYFFLENEQRLGERFYFWSAGSGFDVRMPGSGMLVLYTNVGANPEALPLQQTTQPFNYRIVQADGLGELEACSSTGNDGDDGDPWPGTSNATRFNFTTNPPATWNTLNAWTGLDISDVEEDGSGSVRLTLTWVPTNIPSLRFIDPPGGVSVSNLYRIQYEATDVFGGTTLRVFYMPDRQTCSGSGALCIRNSDCPSSQFCRYDVTVSPTNAKFIAERRKTSPGTDQLSTDWSITGVADGRYVLFAKLMPGQGADGFENSFTTPRAGRNNVGSGFMTVVSVAIDDDAQDSDDKARLETWTAVCIDAAAGSWRVNSTLTQPVLNELDPNADPYPRATTGQTYNSVGGEVSFRILAGTTPYAVGDSFTFTTTGVTAPSRTVTIANGRISEDPTAVIVASPLDGDPPLTVNFDARSSIEPNGAQLSFTWNFGDGAQTTGPIVQHTYTQPGTFTAVLRATNPANGRFGEAQVDIDVTNNSPTAVISATPTNGQAPLPVDFTAAQSSDVESPVSLLIYQWDFGDGTTANNQQDVGTVFQSVSHTYFNDANGIPCTSTRPCEFTATLTVTDEGGKQDTDSVLIRVGNTDPVPIIIQTSLTGPSPFTVVFNAKTSTDPEGQPLTVEWDWDDGTANETYPATTGKPPATDGSVPHTFTLPINVTNQTYRVTATVRDNAGGESRWAGVTVTVTAPVATSSDPRAIFTLNPDPPVLNQQFTADGTLSFDRPEVGGRITAYTWSWGDGTPNGSGAVATHTYTRAGTFRLTLTVTDNDSPPRTHSVSRDIVIVSPGGGGTGENLPPIANLVVTPTRGFAGVTAFTFNASASTDPDGDRTRLVYTWSFGDGATAAGSVVTHTYLAPNPAGYLVRLQVRDEDNATTEISQTVIIDDPTDNRSPVAVITTGVRRGTAPLTLNFDGRNSFDPDGDELSFRWEFRNVAGDLIDTLIGPTVTRTFNSAGSFGVELQVSDNRGGIDRAGPDTVVVTAGIALPEPPPTTPEPDDNEPPDSANQRPNTALCGLGMILGMFGSLAGISLVKIRRRRSEAPARCL